jgi:hypothetical protein
MLSSAKWISAKDPFPCNVNRDEGKKKEQLKHTTEVAFSVTLPNEINIKGKKREAINPEP